MVRSRRLGRAQPMQAREHKRANQGHAELAALAKQHRAHEHGADREI